jgi:hypothetical protein
MLLDLETAWIWLPKTGCTKCT